MSNLSMSNLSMADVSRINRSREKTHRDMNARLNDRDNIDIHIRNNNMKNMRPTNRIDLERDEFMKCSNNDEENEEYDRNISQIESNYDRRMPMRPEFNMNRQRYDDSSNMFPPSMKDLKNNRQMNKKNDDKLLPYETNFSFADINQDTKLTDNIQDNKVCINGISNYGLFLFDNLLETMKGPFIFSPYLIYSMFGALFVASDGNTEVELKNYFNYPRSDILTNGLNDIQTIMETHQSIRKGNCIIFSDDIDYNPQFCKNINNFTKVRKINKQNSFGEAEEINKIIYAITNNTKRSVSKELLEKSSIILLNYASINPVWLSHFTKTSSNDGINFMHAYNQSFGYYDQPNLQVLEIMSKDKLCLGLIYGDTELNEKSLKMIISNLKLTTLQEVKIPKFKLQTKIRYNNILKETDLKTVFMDLKTPYLFNSDCEISDCIQNIEFNLNENSIPSDNKNTNFVTSKKFIIERSFRFYIRSQINNCILFLGTF
jgi:serine protease inhibitor